MSEADEQKPTPDRILQTGMGFWPAKVLLAGVKLGLFSALADGPKSAHVIQDELGLHQRPLYDFLDALVALGFLERDGFGEQAVYRSSADADAFLDPGKEGYVGGILEMANDRLYGFWGDLEEALQTGEPQSEIKHEGVELFDKLYKDPDRMRLFLEAMAGVQKGSFQVLAERFEFERYRTMCDVGGALAALSIAVVRCHPHMRCISTDLPVVEPLARRAVEAAGIAGRVEIRSLDFQTEPFPEVDIVTMGNILHDWGLEDKKMLIRKAWEALNDGGALIVIENIIDDERRENAFGLMMSLNMLIETRHGFDFTGAQFDAWARGAGFDRTELVPLAGPTSAAVAYK